MRTPKRDCVDLALFGGQPAFPEKLHVGRPNIPNRKRLLDRIDSMLSRRWLSNNGPYLQEFEQRVSEYIAMKHCVATCNGTLGLQIAIKSLGLTGEVIVPSFTFVATAHALQWLGITPVFCDVDARTHNIDPYQVEHLITPHTTGIIGVHLWGRPCEIERLVNIADQHGLELMFDAAHAFSCSYKGHMIGSFGSLEVFSFHATKFFNTFEGGAIVTQHDDLAAKARAIRDFGFAPDNEVIDVGTNGKMTEVCAAMGLTGLECLDEFIAANYANYSQYEAELAHLPGVRFMSFEGDDRFNYQYVVLEIDETVTQISRDQMLDVLHAENILARRYFYPGCHRSEPYRSRFPDARQQLPVTDLLSRRVLVLPNGTAIGPDDVGGVCEIVRLVVTHSEEVRDRLLHSAHPAGFCGRRGPEAMRGEVGHQRSAGHSTQDRRCTAWLSERNLRPILNRCGPFVMPPVSTDALVDVANLVRVCLTQNIPGAFVECGVWKGGTAFLMAELLNQAGVRDRKVWLFDSFEGMPPVEPVDGEAALSEANDPESFLSAEKSRVPIEEVRHAGDELGLSDYLNLVKGWFSETLPGTRQRVGPIALLHIDCDWYSSVRCCLENLYDQVTEGGFIFLDDYYHYDGCTVALHEFLAKRRLPHRIETVGGKQWGGCEYYYAARFRKGESNWKAEYLLHLAAQDIAATIASDQAVIVVGEELRRKITAAQRTIPFLEKNGEYWGCPEDDETAIRELERLRKRGAEFIVFPWTAFWWFEEYAKLARHLQDRYAHVLSNDRLALYYLGSS